MQGYLQYSDAEIGPYLNIGTLRTSDKDYTIKPQTVDSRIGDPVPVAYEVNVLATLLDATTDFYSEVEWYFRIYFPDTNAEIRLHQRYYLPEFSGELNRHTITEHKIKLQFSIRPDEYLFYVTGLDAGEEPEMSAMLDDLDQFAAVYINV